jgi:hypothetical protein
VTGLPANRSIGSLHNNGQQEPLAASPAFPAGKKPKTDLRVISSSIPSTGFAFVGAWVEIGFLPSLKK